MVLSSHPASDLTAATRHWNSGGPETTERQHTSINEAKARELLASYNVPFAPWRCTTADSATSDAAVELGFPVVLKAIEPEIPHKTEAGLVHVNLRNEEEMIAGQRELLVGMFRGLPAIDLEALTDIVLALSRLALERPEITEIDIDINPLIIPDTEPSPRYDLVTFLSPLRACRALAHMADYAKYMKSLSDGNSYPEDRVAATE
ncbi:MAG: hypothetical protein GX604_09720 [Actinobacteria bacterium]|nr:hypothetical protein [Actinomycetota bacterium]